MVLQWTNSWRTPDFVESHSRLDHCKHNTSLHVSYVLAARISKMRFFDCFPLKVISSRARTLHKGFAFGMRSVSIRCVWELSPLLGLFDLVSGYQKVPAFTRRKVPCQELIDTLEYSKKTSAVINKVWNSPLEKYSLGLLTETFQICFWSIHCIENYWPFYCFSPNLQTFWPIGFKFQCCWFATKAMEEAKVTEVEIDEVRRWKLWWTVGPLKMRFDVALMFCSATWR